MDWEWPYAYINMYLSRVPSITGRVSTSIKLEMLEFWNSEYYMEESCPGELPRPTADIERGLGCVKPLRFWYSLSQCNLDIPD